MKKLIFISLLLFSCQNSEKILEFNIIPDNPLFYISINSYNDLSLDEIKFVKEFLNIDLQIKSIFNSSKNIGYSFHQIGKDSYGKFIAYENEEKDTFKVLDSFSYNTNTIYKIRISDDNYFYSNYKKIKIISDNQILIENYLRKSDYKKNPKSKNFFNLLELKSKSNNLSVLVSENYENLRLKNIPLKIKDISDWVNFEFNISKDEIIMNGTSFFEKNQNRIINILKDNTLKKSNILDLIPDRIESFKSLSFNYNNFIKNINENFNFNNTKNIEIDSIFYDADEIAYFKNNNTSNLIVNLSNIRFLKKLESQYEKTYRDEKIYKLTRKLKGFDKIQEFSFINSLLYFTIINSNLVLSSDISSMEDLIFDYKNDRTLSKNEKFIEFRKNIPSTNSLLEIVKTNDKKGKMPFLFKRFRIKDSINYTTYFSKTTKNKISISNDLILNKSFDKEIITPPTLINNYVTGEQNIIFQDESFKISLMTLNGKILWSNQLNNKIISKIFQVDTYKNKRLQFLFSTNNEVILMDIKGNIIKSLKNKDEDTIKFLSKFDYDNNRNYRYLVVSENETNMIDSKFKIIKGFKPKHDSNISEPYKHIRVSNRDYIVSKNSNGTVSILNRRGAVRIKLPKDLTFTSNLYEYKNGMIGIISSNKIIKIDISGKISNDLNLNGINQINANKKNIVYSYENKIIINGLSYDLPYATYSKLSIFETSNKSYYSITDLENNKVYLFDESGLVNGFPMFSSSEVSLNEYKNKKFMTFLGDSSELLLYSIN